jgi:hypothetical protein
MGCVMSVGLSSDMANKAFPAESKEKLQQEQLLLDTFFKDRWVPPMSPSTPRSPPSTPRSPMVSPQPAKRFRLE